MRSRETILVLTLLLLAPLAAAQEEEPTVNESDYDTSEPAADESYLDEAQAEAAGEPTLTEAEMDTSLPPADESYLDEAEAEAAAPTDGGTAGEEPRGTPGVGFWASLVGLAALALVLRRR